MSSAASACFGLTASIDLFEFEGPLCVLDTCGTRSRALSKPTQYAHLFPADRVISPYVSRHEWSIGIIGPAAQRSNPGAVLTRPMDLL